MTDLTHEDRVLLAEAEENAQASRPLEQVLLGDAIQTENLDLWFRLLGHLNRLDLAKGLIHCLASETGRKSKASVCEACAKAKSSRHSFARAKRANVSKAMPSRTKPETDRC